MSDSSASTTIRRSRTQSRLSVVVPCYNEQEVVELTHRKLIDTLNCAALAGFEIVYVDDGSSDRTPDILERLASDDSRVVVVILSRNFGHQAAVTAGMRQATGDAVVVIDADLQDPPEIILAMLGQWENGYDIVYGIRKQRKEGAFKRSAYFIFYRVYRALSDIDVPLDSGDFALIDRRSLDVINKLPEKNRFIRGLRSWAGFNQKGVFYDRSLRAAGEPKYTIRKLVVLAADGIFNFSITPLTYIFLFGLVSSLIALISLVFFIVHRIIGFKIFGYSPQDVPGFTSLILSLLFFSGVQMVSIGILGAYIGRMYQEVKGRPPYVVDRVVQASQVSPVPISRERR